MDELDIKRECKVTWAMNFGSFGSSSSMNQLASFEIEDNKTKKKKQSLAGKTKEEAQAIKNDQAYKNCMRIEGGNTRTGKRSNLGLIAKGIEAGGLLAKIKKLGPMVEMWSYLAYREDTLVRKQGVMRLLLLMLYDDFRAKQKIKRNHLGKILPIIHHELVNILHGYDARFPKLTKKESFKDYKNPSDFAKYYQSYFNEVDRMILGLDIKLKGCLYG